MTELGVSYTAGHLCDDCPDCICPGGEHVCSWDCECPDVPAPESMGTATIPKRQED